MRIGTIQRYWWLAISDDCQELMLVEGEEEPGFGKWATLS